MAETLNGWLAEQLQDPEFAAAYTEISKQVDSEFAAIQAARSTLAQKVIEVVVAATIDERFSGHWRLGFSQAQSTIDTALRDLFRSEGIELED